jgi:hypothetical protein
MLINYVTYADMFASIYIFVSFTESYISYTKF